MSRDYMGKSEIDSERRDALADASLDDEGIDFALVQLCKYLGVDPDDVTWDAATETVDGDVQAVIGNIFCTKFGEDWSPSDPHSSEQAAQGWQPIETAPKDGTPVDLFSQYGRRWCNYRWDKQIRRGMWSDAAYAHRVWHDRPCMYEASVTHWMPIPSAPVSGSTEDGNG